MKASRPMAASIAAIAGLAMVTACSSGGSSSGASSGASSGGGSATAAAGSPIKILVISQLQAASFSFPEIANGAEAAAAAINAAGGVNRHPVQVSTCNDQGNPNVAATCARTAVTGNYTAVIAPTTLYAASVLPLLQAAQIPYSGNALDTIEYTNPDSFPVNGGDPLDYGGAGYVEAQAGCKNAAIITDTSADSVDTAMPAAARGFASGGGHPVTTIIKAADTNPDFSAPVSQAVSSGAGCLLLVEAPAAVAKIVAAVRQSPKPDMPIATLAAAFPQALVTSLGKAANGVTLTESFAIPSATGTPVFWADMQKYQPSAARSSQALLAWIEVNLVKQVAAQAKAYDHQSLLAALKQTANVDIEGMGGPVNFSQPNADSGISRIFAHYDFVYEVENGAFIPQDGGKGVNVSSVLP